MKLNVLISTSRKTTAKLNVKEHLLSKGYAIGQVLESDDFPKTAGEDSTQIKINLETIPQMDWFILLAPLDHVGSKTFSELKAACDSYLATGKPTISIFHSSNPIHIEKKEGDVDFQDMLGYLEDKMRSKWKREQTEQLVQDSEQYYNVKTAYEASQARYEQVLRAKHSTSLVKSEQTHRLGQNEAAVRLAQAVVELAQLNLSYTVIVATCDGVTGKKDIHEGQLVQPGQTMVDIVDGSDLWVIANYRETQLPNIKEGYKVTLTADAVPGVTYTGVVESISDATGAAFSLIPQDNATGNFVKVEQRVPVRISLKENSADKLKLLRAGFNVECKVKY